MDTKEQIESTTWNFLRSKGLNEKSTASVMGNIYAESSFDPSLVEVGNGIGYGLCQWSYTRRTQLEAYGTDLAHQFNFLWSELTGQDTSTTGADYQWINKSGYINHDDFMNGNGTINDLTASFCFCWERPNVDLAHLDVRQTSANGYYTQFTGTVITDPGGGTVQTVKLKNNYIYGCSDKLFGRKFIINGPITLEKTLGDKAYIKVNNRLYIVPKNNLILS